MALRLPGMPDPLSALNAMAGLAREGGQLVARAIPDRSEQFMRRDLDLLNSGLREIGFHNQFLGEPQYTSIRDPRTGNIEYAQMNVGGAPMVPFGRFAQAGAAQAPFFVRAGPARGEPISHLLQGGATRLGPSASKGERMRRSLLSQERREGNRALLAQQGQLQFLPELSPQQNAFREYLLQNRDPENALQALADAVSGQGGMRLAEGARHSLQDQNKMLIEEMEDVLPKGILGPALRDLPPREQQELQGLFLHTRAQADRARRAGTSMPDQPYVFEDARRQAQRILEVGMQARQRSGDMREAASLAAQLLFLNRSRRNLFEQSFPQYMLPSGRPTWTHEASMLIDRDLQLKELFRRLMARKRMGGGPPRYRHEGG